MATILIANENEDIRDLIKLILKDGNLLIIAENGWQAIELFNKYRPEVIIVNTVLPKISGFDVVKQIRATALPVTIIATSSNSTDIFKPDVMLTAGADVCFDYPIDLTILKTIVKKIAWPQIPANINLLQHHNYQH